MWIWTVWGCSNPEDAAVQGVKDVVTGDLVALADAVGALRSAAPEDWGAADLGPTEAAWADARDAYERSEGAIAALFPDLDHNMDQRYDGFLAEGPDVYLFDGEGVTGIHAVERIVWSDRMDPSVVAFEQALTGYVPAAFPADAGEAVDYRDGLCQRLVDDADLLIDGFEPLALDPATAYEGVVGSVAEQVEKVNLAQTGEDESRYARYTLADLRANLAGGLAIYEAFSPWVVKEGGDAVDAEVREGFARLQSAYDAIPGDAIPPVPATWSSEAPTEADLATEYGVLWSLVSVASDPAVAGSLVERMVAAADTIGITVVP